MLENENKDLQTPTEQIIENYNNELNKKNREIELLNDKLAEISTVSYSAGTPQIKYNRGDESNDFAFPVKWAQTCKKMETSIYLEPVLQFYKTTFNTFDYQIEMPEEAEENEAVYLAYEFINKQFERAGGLKNLIVNIAYNTLVYGFAFFTPKLEILNGQKYNLKGKLDGLKGFKYYDPTQVYNFVFKENDADELQAITILTSPKVLGGTQDSKGYMLEDYYNEWAKGNFENAKFIKIDFDLMLGGYATYGNITGDVIGRPFLYSAYPLWQVLESMDNSFNRNLSNIGEHSFNFVSTSSEPISDTDRNEIKRELQEWVNKKGGIFLSKYGKVEKIECIDANEWWQFRDSMLSTLFKNKGLDIKALGLNRGATKDLASYAQTDSVLMANDIMENIIMSINNTFMKRYFDLNFRELRIYGDCDYFKIKHSLPEAQQKNQNGNFNIAMSGTIPEGAEWKTLDNGEHVLVKNGEIIAGAGIEQWKNKGKKTSEENKKENKSDTKTISAKQYRENQKEIEFSKKKIAELEDTIKRFPNDSMFNGDRQEEIEWHKKQIAIMEDENKQYESGKGKVNAEKNGESKKKITKNYSIAYDKETIDKLNETGKNWQDKRIYFDELNNSYYDLEKEKWVCDSPETTKKALALASENAEDRANRIKQEKEEAWQRDYDRRQSINKTVDSMKARMNSEEFDKQLLKAMNNAGVFEDMTIPQGSISKITNELFTEEERKVYNSKDSYATEYLTDTVFNKTKNKLYDLQQAYQPKRWNEWLYTVKNIDNGKIKTDESWEEMMDNLNFSSSDKELYKDYERAKMGITKMSNSDAWAKFGDEFNKYKSDYKKTSKKKLKEYISELLKDSADASGIKSDDGSIKQTIKIKDQNGNITSQKTTYDKNKNPISQESKIWLGKFIKRKPSGVESYIIKDTSLLNQNLIVLSDELNDYILQFMKEAMKDTKLIELALKKPDEFIKTSLLTPAKRKELLEELKGILERNVGDLFDIKAKEILQGSATKDFKALFGMTQSDWINKMTQEYIRKNAINVGRALIARTELKSMEALRNFTSGYTKDNDLSEAVNVVFERVFNYKGKGIDTASQNEAVSVFQEVSNQANENASKKIKNLAFIRCGYLESMCKECQKYYNVLYVPNGLGGYYNEQGIEYKQLPDSDCLGGKENCKCYYAPIKLEVLDIINNMLEGKQE